MGGRRGFQKQHKFEEKRLALESFLSDEKYKSMSARMFSGVCGINYHTLLSWLRAVEWDVSRIGELRRARKGKDMALEDLCRLPAASQELILAVKGRFPGWGPLKIKQYLFRHEQALIPQTAIYKFLKSKGLVEERAAEAAPAEPRRFEYGYPLAAVQMDLMSLRLSGGAVIHLVSMLDDHSRFVLCARFVAAKTMDLVIDAFSETVRTHGVMERLLTDHGSEFVSWHNFTKFEELLCSLDVEHIASGPGKKQNQGKVERWHGTVRGAARAHGPLEFGGEAQLWIRRVADVYNYERPHEGIGGLLPADRFFGVADELEAELERHKAGSRAGQRIYFACRVGDKKIVVAGPRAGDLSVLVDGRRLPDGNSAVGKEKMSSAGAGAPGAGDGQPAMAEPDSAVGKEEKMRPPTGGAGRRRRPPSGGTVRRKA